MPNSCCIVLFCLLLQTDVPISLSYRIEYSMYIVHNRKISCIKCSSVSIISIYLSTSLSMYVSLHFLAFFCLAQSVGTTTLILSVPWQRWELQRNRWKGGLKRTSNIDAIFGEIEIILPRKYVLQISCLVYHVKLVFLSSLTDQQMHRNAIQCSEHGQCI